MDIFTIYLLTPFVAMGIPVIFSFFLAGCMAVFILITVIANIWWILPLYLICQVVF